jgi:hypothetical protein
VAVALNELPALAGRAALKTKVAKPLASEVTVRETRKV